MKIKCDKKSDNVVLSGKRATMALIFDLAIAAIDSQSVAPLQRASARNQIVTLKENMYNMCEDEVYSVLDNPNL